MKQKKDAKTPKKASEPEAPAPSKDKKKEQPSESASSKSQAAIDPSNTSVFEFGSATAADENFTLAGYCPVSDDLEPCHWQLLPTGGAEAPKFRVIF